MNYSQAIAYIHGTYKFGRKLGLNQITTLLAYMDNPHKALEVIHVAGTNGKGSTSSYLALMLQEAGYRVGLFSSPFLQVFNERIRLNGQNIDNESLGEITGFVKEKVDLMLAEGFDHPTEFEVVTAIAFEYYRRLKAQIVVLEVGMGGRLDSTNVIDNPLVSVITPIAMDHMEYLGETLGAIASEKAGIIKAGRPVTVSFQEPDALKVIQEKAHREQSPIKLLDSRDIEVERETLRGSRFRFKGKTYEIGLLGTHQIFNAALSLLAAETLEEYSDFVIPEAAKVEGLKKTRWPGRMEIIGRRPLVIIDGAHNQQGAQSLAKTLGSLFRGKRIIGLIGILADKDVRSILDPVMPLLDEVVLTEPHSPRRMSHGELAGIVAGYGIPQEGYAGIDEAFIAAKNKAGKEDVVIAFGSLYMIGEVRSLFVE
ncbi:MAG: hypothetical protein AVO33_08730 [delta proteobacterium ML8_F1]|nr:MAG: hypothetical protein AVO33_08730 [delta proteobacterium ML8_F1]